MRGFVTFLASCLVLPLAACSRPKAVEARDSQQPANTPEVRQSTKVIQACSLLTSNEIEAIQGAPPKETKLSTNTREGLTVSECYFLLPTAADSIVLTVTQKADGSNSRDPKQSWEELFRDDKEGENAREKEERKSPPPEEITGLGDEAFWVPQRFGGVLYALKGDVYIRISVGGLGDQATKIKKSKSLAEIVLKRL